LIDKGVDINVTDQYGLSPLVYAMKTKNKPMVDLIRSAGGEY
jgi:ankyrin repeat protein